MTESTHGKVPKTPKTPKRTPIFEDDANTVTAELTMSTGTAGKKEMKDKDLRIALSPGLVAAVTSSATSQSAPSHGVHQQTRTNITDENAIPLNENRAQAGDGGYKKCDEDVNENGEEEDELGVYVSKEDLAKVVELKRRYDDALDELDAVKSRLTEMEANFAKERKEAERRLAQTQEENLNQLESKQQVQNDLRREVEQHSDLKNKYAAKLSELQTALKERAYQEKQALLSAQELQKEQQHSKYLLKQLQDAQVRLEEANRVQVKTRKLAAGANLLRRRRQRGGADKDSLTGEDGKRQEGAADGADGGGDSIAAAAAAADGEGDGDVSGGDVDMDVDVDTEYVELRLQTQVLQRATARLETELAQERAVNQTNEQTIEVQKAELFRMSQAVESIKRQMEANLAAEALGSPISGGGASSASTSTSTGGRAPPRPYDAGGQWKDAAERIAVTTELLQTRSMLEAANEAAERAIAGERRMHAKVLVGAVVALLVVVAMLILL